MNSTVSITYFTDPLCCWSWAMQSTVREIKQSHGDNVNWRYCMGGLIPGWKLFTDTVNSVSRPIQMGPLWMYAAHMAGVPIDHNIWFRDPPASSYPACIAIKSVALQNEKYASCYFDLLQESCLQNGRNIAKEKELVIVAGQVQKMFPAFDADLFKENLHDGKARASFAADLNEIKLAGINRFPTMILRSASSAPLLISGYKSATELNEIIEGLLLISNPSGFNNNSNLI